MISGFIKRVRPVLLAACALMALSHLVQGQRKRTPPKRRTVDIRELATVTADTAGLFKVPSSASEQVGEVKKGDKLWLIQPSNGGSWYSVLSENQGWEGWVESSAVELETVGVEEIEPPRGSFSAAKEPPPGLPGGATHGGLPGGATHGELPKFSLVSPESTEAEPRLQPPGGFPPITDSKGAGGGTGTGGRPLKKNAPGSVPGGVPGGVPLGRYYAIPEIFGIPLDDKKPMEWKRYSPEGVQLSIDLPGEPHEMPHVLPDYMKGSKMYGTYRKDLMTVVARFETPGPVNDAILTAAFTAMLTHISQGSEVKYEIVSRGPDGIVMRGAATAMGVPVEVRALLSSKGTSAWMIINTFTLSSAGTSRTAADRIIKSVKLEPKAKSGGILSVFEEGGNGLGLV